jgi:DNA recombination protein RmuC
MIQNVVWIAVGLLLAINLVLLIQVWKRLALMKKGEAEEVMQNELRSLKENQEVMTKTLMATVGEFGRTLTTQLEARLGESHQTLQNVQRGLGEMQSLATDVSDLKRVLTSVRARGTWGEVQLGSLLEEVLTPDQYSTNVQLRENSGERVEYAIRLPGSNDGPDSCVWLPIDSKFPLADYERLVDASDEGTLQEATQALIRVVQTEAKKIQDKYISPPKTTDFAIMFLPTEGLYTEVLRASDQVTEFFQHYRIVVAGPTTLASILSGLRMGFRTLAIEQRSSEVWQLLAVVKTEFNSFNETMERLKNNLNTASNTVGRTETRIRAMERKLRDVEVLSQEEATATLELSNSD